MVLRSDQKRCGLASLYPSRDDVEVPPLAVAVDEKVNDQTEMVRSGRDSRSVAQTIRVDACKVQAKSAKTITYQLSSIDRNMVSAPQTSRRQRPKGRPRALLGCQLASGRARLQYRCGVALIMACGFADSACGTVRHSIQ